MVAWNDESNRGTPKAGCVKELRSTFAAALLTAGGGSDSPPKGALDDARISAWTCAYFSGEVLPAGIAFKRGKLVPHQLRMDFSRFNHYKEAPPAKDPGGWARMHPGDPR
jgi:hypothetical protein